MTMHFENNDAAQAEFLTKANTGNVAKLAKDLRDAADGLDRAAEAVVPACRLLAVQVISTKAFHLGDVGEQAQLDQVAQAIVQRGLLVSSAAKMFMEIAKDLRRQADELSKAWDDATGGAT